MARRPDGRRGDPGREGWRERGGGGEVRLGGRGRGWGGEGGSPVPLPPPGPGPPADSAPTASVASARTHSARGCSGGGGGAGGQAAGGAAAEAAAPARGSGAKGPSRGRRGLRLQRTGTAGEESTAQARCGHRCQSERGGARAPAVSKATGRRGKDSSNLHLVLATAAGGQRRGATRTVPLHCHSNKEKKPPHKFTVVPRERSYLVTMATGNSPFLFP